ncbi:MAG: sugar phosphorylase [Sedimentisphaerales bacterium]|nr:sugar phosphorylase [Sedimentisphaerales bacterium]
MARPSRTLDILGRLYGPKRAPDIARRLERLLDRYAGLTPAARRRSIPKGGAGQGPVCETGAAPECFSEKDALLITYADSLRDEGTAPLQALERFCRAQLQDVIRIIHLLPFFPYSSDDGFSVTDYRRVNPACGDWPDVARLAERFDLCFDLVLNHASAASGYFQGFLAGDEAYRDFFIRLDPQVDTSSVLRPRTSPLRHRFDAAGGPVWCWTTFSADQIDLNYANPAVLLEFIDILLFYVSRGARVIRLDAIAYLWKQAQTSCAHLPQTHAVVQLLRDLLDRVAPDVCLLTETNVPHRDNISYFGDGTNEAQVVYNFPLPPLVLHTIAAGDATCLTRWAAGLEPPSQRTTFLNFTASHDGIGVRPAADILSAEQFRNLIALAARHGGRVSVKHDQQGNAIPYELNINYFDALNNPNEPADPEIEVRRFLLSQSIALVLRGIPAIYIHSLLGSRGWPEGARRTGQARTINRQPLDLWQVEEQLRQETSLPSRIFYRYRHVLQQRQSQPAFHPNAGQQILDWGSALFVVRRISRDGAESVLAIHNVTGRTQRIFLADQLDHWQPQGTTDLAGGEDLTLVEGILELPPYQFIWWRQKRRP